MELVITAVNSITAVGHNAGMTSASVRAGISRLAEFTDFYGIEGNPITAAFIDGISNEEDDITRTGEIAKYCLEHLIERYFQDGYSSDKEINLLLGVAPFSRPGPRYEGENREIADQLEPV